MSKESVRQLTSTGSTPATRALSASALRTLSRALAVLCWGLLLISLGLLLTYDYGVDQGIFAVIGRSLIHGGVPYRDAFDIKPPGIFFIYAAAQTLFGPTHVGIRLLEAGAMLASTVGMMILARRHWGSALIGLAAAALAAITQVQHEFSYTAQAESFGAPLAVWTLVAASTAVTAPQGWKRWVSWLVVGGFSGLAALLKPTMAGEGPLLALLVTVWHFRTTQMPRRQLLTPLLATGLGLALPIAVCICWFALRGGLHDLYEVLFVFAPQYTRLAWQNSHLPAMIYRAILTLLTGYSSALLVGLLALLWCRPLARELPLVLGVTSALVAHLAGIVTQGKFYDYHWNATFPLTAMLAALGFAAAARHALAAGWKGVGAFAVLLPFIVTASWSPEFVERSQRRLELYAGRELAQPVLDNLSNAPNVFAAEDRQIADFVQAHTPADAPIFVWGFTATIYDRANRFIASRYFYNLTQRANWATATVREELVRELPTSKPSVIVVQSGDSLRWMTGNKLDSAQALEQYPALKSLITQNYQPALKLPHFVVHLRRDLQGGTPAPSPTGEVPIVDTGASAN